MKVTVRDTDHGSMDLLRRAAEFANKVEIGVGVPESAGTYPDGTPVATVAAAHEFGLGVPQRSFIRGWYDGHGPGWFGDRLAQIARDIVINGMQKESRIATFGRQCVREVQERMDAGIEPGLQDETIARKRRSGSATPETPLEDTHRLRNAVTWTTRG
jgi:hypothetical protein